MPDWAYITDVVTGMLFISKTKRLTIKVSLFVLADYCRNYNNPLTLATKNSCTACGLRI